MRNAVHVRVTLIISSALRMRLSSSVASAAKNAKQLLMTRSWMARPRSSDRLISQRRLASNGNRSHPRSGRCGRTRRRRGRRSTNRCTPTTSIALNVRRIRRRERRLSSRVGRVRLSMRRIPRTFHSFSRCQLRATVVPRPLLRHHRTSPSCSPTSTR